MIYTLEFVLSTEVGLLQGGSQARDIALARFNDFCQDQVDPETGEPEYFGTTEGVLLAEEAHERGYETESWVLDVGEAPHERDWIGQEPQLRMVAYFKSAKGAKRALDWLEREYRFEARPQLSTQEEQDWNATWKAAFQGIEISSRLRVLPPWHEEYLRDPATAFDRGVIVINPGAGFGTGTHETTQLCLQILDQCGSLAGKTVLDFGSGSGILGITAAKLGAQVYCVEIDPMANENATENARLNGLKFQAPGAPHLSSAEIRFSTEIPLFLKPGKVDIVLANILRPILLQYSSEIQACLAPHAELILSGLIESDLESVIRAYQGDAAPPKFRIQQFQNHEWRALWCQKRIEDHDRKN